MADKPVINEARRITAQGARFLRARGVDFLYAPNGFTNELRAWCWDNLKTNNFIQTGVYGDDNAMYGTNDIDINELFLDAVSMEFYVNGQWYLSEYYRNRRAFITMTPYGAPGGGFYMLSIQGAREMDFFNPESELDENDFTKKNRLWYGSQTGYARLSEEQMLNMTNGANGNPNNWNGWLKQQIDGENYEYQAASLSVPNTAKMILMCTDDRLFERIKAIDRKELLSQGSLINQAFKVALTPVMYTNAAVYTPTVNFRRVGGGASYNNCPFRLQFFMRYKEIQLAYAFLKNMAIMTRVSPVNMTSNNAPAPYAASASSVYQYSANYPPYRAFDLLTPITNNSNDAWVSADGAFSNNVGNAWLKIDLGTQAKVDEYVLTNRRGGQYVCSPVDFTFEGSNDNVNWTVLDTVTGRAANGVAESTKHRIASAVYRYYRLNITRKNAPDNYVCVGLLELFAIS